MNSRISSVESQTDLQTLLNVNEKRSLRKFTFYVDMEKANTIWQKYDKYTAPILMQHDGNDFLSRTTGYNALLYGNNFHKFLKETTTFMPHEFVDDVLDKTINRQLEGRFKLHKTHLAHKGDTKYWTILNDEEFEVEDGDKVKLGTCVRNGIGTGVSLGFDIFTYRLVCSNGAVLRKQSIGTLSYSHAGKVDRLIDSFTNGLVDVFEGAKKLLDYYRESTQITVTDDMANAIWKGTDLSKVYLPDFWEVAKINNEFKVKVAHKRSLWESFNAITQKQRDRLTKGDVGFDGLAYTQNKLHQEMMAIVDNQRARR